MFQGLYPSEPPAELLNEPVVELALPQDHQLHFTRFKDTIFVQNRH